MASKLDKIESDYQKELIQKIYNLLPGLKYVEVLILKNDPNYLQGIPDLTVFYRNRFALLEVKASAKSKERPNQRYYIESWGEHVFTAFIYPENESEVLLALQQSLAGGRETCVPRCQ